MNHSMPGLFNMLSRLVITFLPRNKCLLISWLQSPSAVILEPPKIKSDTFPTVSASISHEVMGPHAMNQLKWNPEDCRRPWKTENEDHGIQSCHFMANRGETVETVTDFIFLGSKITEDGDCSHEIKRHLLLGRKVMTNLDGILKSRGQVILVKRLHEPP